MYFFPPRFLFIETAFNYFQSNKSIAWRMRNQTQPTLKIMFNFIAHILFEWFAFDSSSFWLNSDAWSRRTAAKREREKYDNSFELNDHLRCSFFSRFVSTGFFYKGTQADDANETWKLFNRNSFIERNEFGFLLLKCCNETTVSVSVDHSLSLICVENRIESMKFLAQFTNRFSWLFAVFFCWFGFWWLFLFVVISSFRKIDLPRRKSQIERNYFIAFDNFQVKLSAFKWMYIYR